MYTDTQISVESLLSVLSDTYPEEFQDHMVILHLIFSGNTILFSPVAAPFWIRLSMHKSSSLSKLYQHILLSGFFIWF
jgi:hypothetical protein